MFAFNSTSLEQAGNHPTHLQNLRHAALHHLHNTGRSAGLVVLHPVLQLITALSALGQKTRQTPQAVEASHRGEGRALLAGQVDVLLQREQKVPLDGPQRLVLYRKGLL